MNIPAKLYLFLIICTLFSQCAKADDANNLDNEQESAATIEITKLDVNDTNLELSWKIVNNTDHDIWICNSLHPGDFFERFLDKDNETLLIRRRFSLTMNASQISKVFASRYVRLRSGQEKIESISIVLPVQSISAFGDPQGNAEYAKRLVLEIGYYNENLPGLILKVVEATEYLNCNLNISNLGFEEVFDRFFGGWYIAFTFLRDTGFSESITSDSDEIKIPYMGRRSPVLNGEQVLRAEIDGVSIPINSNSLLLTNQDVNEPDDLQDSDVSISLTHFEITDANLELGWKIINNTDHDVWICDSVNPPSSCQFEVFLSEDSQTLLIRKRLDVPTSAIWRVRPVGKYILLRPGENRPESLSLSLPIQPTFTYASEGPTEVTECIKCIALEIGFYDEDLPALIRSILQVAEKFSGTVSDIDGAIFKDYFRGLWVKNSLGTLEGFDSLNKDPYNDGRVLIPYSYQALTGEKVLQINIDGVSISYQGKVQFISQ